MERTETDLQVGERASPYISTYASPVAPATDRLRNVATIGVRTFGWTFANRKLDLPGPAPRVELQRVSVPVPVACREPMPVRPSYPTENLRPPVTLDAFAAVPRLDTVLVAVAADFLRKGGMDVTDQDVAGGIEALVTALLQAGGVDPDKVAEIGARGAKTDGTMPAPKTGEAAEGEA